MKRVLSVIALLLASIILLCACNVTTPPQDTGAPTGSDSSSDNTVTPSTGDENTPPDGLVTVVDNSRSDYKIVRSDSASTVIKDSLNELRESFKSVFAVDTTKQLLPANDWTDKLGDDGCVRNDDREILIGSTNRYETKYVLDQLTTGEYAVALVGSKVVIVGTNDYLSTLAVSLFIEKYLVNDGSNTLKIADGTFAKGKSDVSTIGDTDATVRIMTYNILNTSGLDTRAAYIINSVTTYSPGIVCFQECANGNYGKVIAKLKEYNYKSAHDTHEGTTTKVYTPIVYRTDLYRLVESGQEWLEKRYTKTNTKCIAWAVFEEIASGKQFAVINIHVSLWSRNYDLPDGKTHEDMFAEAAQWKVDNMNQMNACMNTILEKYPDIPCLWTGDFNFDLNNKAYAAVMSFGMKDAEFTATESRTTGMRSFHNAAGQAPTAGNSIDHIFGNKYITFRNHKICMTESDILGSDHCPVYADVKLGN